MLTKTRSLEQLLPMPNRPHHAFQNLTKNLASFTSSCVVASLGNPSVLWNCGQKSLLRILSEWKHVFITEAGLHTFSSLTYLRANTGFSFINWDQIESNIWSAPVQTTLNHEILWNVLIAKQLPAVAEEVRSLTSLTQLNLRFDQLTTASDKRMKSSMRLFLHILHFAFCINVISWYQNWAFTIIFLLWPYYFMDYHWWDTTAEKLFLIFLSTGNAVLPIFCSAHFGWRDICCQVDLLFSDTFVLARGHFVTARLQSLLPKYNYWKVLNCNWKSNCSDQLQGGTGCLQQ